MSSEFQRQNPAGMAKVMGLIEGGLGTEEIARVLYDESVTKALEIVEGVGTREETIPDEIRIIAQALAYREDVYEEDLAKIYSVINQAYIAETRGPEAFREGDAVSFETIHGIFEDEAYKWLIVEAPNGHGTEVDGAILGVACFSTDGLSRRNGEVEGRLGSIRLFGVVPRFHGLCIGLRLLRRLESTMFRLGFCRAMACIPSPRQSICRWLERKDFLKAGVSSYPNIGHTVTRDDAQLIIYLKPLEDQNLEGVSLKADTKVKPVIKLRQPGDDENGNNEEPQPVSSSSSSSQLTMKQQQQQGSSSSSAPPPSVAAAVVAAAVDDTTINSAAAATTVAGESELSKESFSVSNNKRPAQGSRLHLPPMWRTFGFDQEIAPPLPPEDSEGEEADMTADGKQRPSKVSYSMVGVGSAGSSDDINLDVD